MGQRITKTEGQNQVWHLDLKTKLSQLGLQYSESILGFCIGIESMAMVANDLIDVCVCGGGNYSLLLHS